MRKVNNNNYVYNKNQNQKQIISSPNSDFPMNSNSNFPINNIPQKLGNILEPTSPQEMNPEILNISKVKDGFFIGDRISAISIEVITEFKISHIINTTGEQIINQWESIGINYLTINWSENENQILFDINDEIAEKIVEFIDKALFLGEGVLAHSFNGKNRVCIVSIIYLMKKYKWSLYKSMQYLKSKKNDIEISNYFYIQLENFQKRLIQKGELARDIPWEFENLIDEEEKLLRNTYMNGLPTIKNINDNEKNNNKIMDLLIGNDNINDDNISGKYIKIKHIIWADNNPFFNQQKKIEILNTNNDLCLKKDIKPIFSHLKCIPIKSCIKNHKNKFSDIQFNINFNKNNNINIIKQKISFDNTEKSLYRTEFINKLEKNKDVNNIKNNKILINYIDKNISDNNTNSNTPAEDIKDQYENRLDNDLNNIFTFNIGSINSLSPANRNNFRIFEENYGKEKPSLGNKNKELNIQNDIINYIPIHMNNKSNNANNNPENNIRTSYVLGNNKKNQNYINSSSLNKPLNNFNPNLIGMKNHPTPGRDNFKSSHPLFNKNKNKKNAPIKIKNYNNNSHKYSNIKKPTTPVVSHTNNSINFTSKDNITNTKNTPIRYNSTKKSSSFSNNFNSTSTGISFNSNSISKKNINKSNSERPSTAPHKDKTKIINNGINFNSNLSPKNNKNIKTPIKSKINQRPLSAENKNKIKNKTNNFGKSYLSNNNQNNLKFNNYYNNLYGTGNNNYNSKEMSQNNIKSNNLQKYNLAKQRRPSPIIKTDNILNKKANK